MTATQARQLLVGTIVTWDGNPDDLGTVRRIGPNGLFIDWVDGKVGWVYFEDAAKVSVR